MQNNSYLMSYCFERPTDLKKPYYLGVLPFDDTAFEPGTLLNPAWSVTGATIIFHVMFVSHSPRYGR